MNESAIKSRREYMREWARKNPDKVKEHQRRYWEKRAAAEQEAAEPARREA